MQQILLAAESADASLGEDLWLIAERIMLYRLTRAGEQKRLELASMVHLFRKIISETRGEQNLPPELTELDEAAADDFRGSAEAKLSLVFTTIVDLAENMSTDQLYLLISALRKMDLPAQEEEEEVRVEPVHKAQEYLSEGFQQEDDDWNLQ